MQVGIRNISVPAYELSSPFLDYEGSRKASDIVKHVVELIPDHVIRVRDNTLESFLSKKNESAKAILFTNKGVATPLWKALAIDYLGAVEFAQIRNKEKEAVEVFGIEKYPTIVLLPGGEAEGIVYSGVVSKDGLLKFFQAIVPLPEEPPAKSEKPKTKKPKPTESEEPRGTEETEPGSSEAVPETPEEDKRPTPKRKDPFALLTLYASARANNLIAEPSIPSLGDQGDLTAACLTPKSKTCILAITTSPSSPVLTGVYAKMLHRGPPGGFKVYTLPAESSHAISLAEKLQMTGDGAKLFAINARRNWIKKFGGDVDSEEEVLAWLDATRLGDGAKEKLPSGVVVEQPEEKEMPHEEL